MASCEPASDLSDGPVHLTATAEDFVGNVSEPAEVGFSIDTVVPTIQVESPPAAATEELLTTEPM